MRDTFSKQWLESSTNPVLICPVRGCQARLMREARALVCPRGHNFDRARSGYYNLLQPQERRSKQPGDTPAAVMARRRLHDLGVTATLLTGIEEMVEAGSGDALLDAGCGDGFYLGSLEKQTGCHACGIDISTTSVELASRRFPDCEWIVGNADRLIPYGNESFSLVLSITARMNASEFRRVLKPDGRLLVALPAPDDLQELRGPGRERVARTVEHFAKEFAVTAENRVTTRASLDASAVADVLLSIYRPLQPTAPSAMTVTFSLDLLLFRPR